MVNVSVTDPGAAHDDGAPASLAAAEQAQSR